MRIRTARSTSLLLLVLAVAPARAAVTQVDGTVVPVMTGVACAGNVQICLNTEEGGPTINAQADAEQLPETFLPNLTTTVTFEDIGEGAGFENSFGYYNVGTDPTITTNLHPILGCGVTAANHASEAAGYFVNAEVGSIASVNFGTEMAAGRYTGGYIAFYLITPEGNPSANNCGDFVNGTDGLSLFGRSYFTERDLNNDGDFVHSIVWTSVTFTQRFYFGFEDLFRGGDNDFEDMAIAVAGLTPPCLPITETCNGQDDDCDTVVDNMPIDVGSACSTGIGACQTSGVTVCTAGSEVCGATAGTPTAEMCNSIDDNCDGLVDNSPVDVGSPCTVGTGTCQNSAVTVCTGGFEQCGASPGAPGTELCNTLDDDCDTLIDEDYGLGLACDGVGVCGPGVIECDGPTASQCSTDPGGSMDGSSPEVCNGLDDDCDGFVDEGASGVGLPCTVGTGACTNSGTTICAGGAPVCGVAPGLPQVELCDGLDNDCDGTSDEDYGVGLVCDGIGQCGLGVIECLSSNSTICSTDVGGSMDQSQPETCDTLDNDCDGTTDEGLNDLGPCGLSNVGECADGILRCTAGAVTCVGAALPTMEFCDGLDNDCDGIVDDAVVDDGDLCGIDTGQCNYGVQTCVGGALMCVGGQGPVSEDCNGLDDNCDGIVDDNPAGIDVVCGVSDVGECAFGLTICTGGTITCNGEVGPTVETCEGLDNDCDGVNDNDPVDDGGPCGIAVGICTPGVFVCTMGMLVCQGEMGGTPELCNGFDDDCNGLIDDMPIDAGGICGETIGACEPGMLLCIAGMIQCVGGVGPTTETCNGLDDDCDGMGDEGDLCEGGVCTIDGICASPCQPGELPCPPGLMCEAGFCIDDPCFGITCPDAPGGVMQVCEGGACVDACSQITCSGGFVCRPDDGLCVPDNCIFLPEKCTAGEICNAGECITDLCIPVTCAEDQFCRPTEGLCVDSCAGVDCGPTEKCESGACVPTGCALACPSGQICREADGVCVNDPCQSAGCPAGEACDPQTGDCIADPCTGVDCPGEERCVLGDCFAPDTPGVVDGGPEIGVYATGGGGCSAGGGVVGGGGGDGGGGAWLLVLAALPLLWRRRLAVLLVALLAGAGCDVEPFYFGVDASGTGGDGGGDSGVDDDSGVRPDARGDAGCLSGAPEVCNQLDDDCDQLVDENFNLDTDETNCGMCGVSCAKAGSLTECQTGDCAITGCFPGFVDLDGDLGLPFDASNGCEYACFVSNGGVEACDGLDNDCDGLTDEDTDFAGDEVNCGVCGRVCAFFQATATCTAGLCEFDPATDCSPDFYDDNGLQADGCEYACTITNGGVEDCDSLDNNCDGVVDEVFDLGSNPLNCGLCGYACTFPNATPSCVMGGCEFDPATDCDPGFHDANGTQIDGCEYACNVTNGGVEICDGLDNDCDATSDDASEVAVNDGTIGLTCGATDVGECIAGTTACVSGTATCVGAFGPRLEQCDGLDNDCDGVADDAADLIDTGQICAPSIGQCSFGLSVCTAGALDCVRDTGPSSEVCDAIDNDCNGITDDSPIDVGLTCGGGPVNGGTSQCVQALTACNVGVLSCPGQVGPSAETCDGVDDDCDGVVDDAALLVGSACGTDVGQCSTGTFTCPAGSLVCSGGTGPGAELCDGFDNDCSGLPDDNLMDPAVGVACGMTGVGECTLGAQICSGGTIACAGAIGPSGEACDGQDDDCDGLTDENAAGTALTQVCYSGPGGTQNVGLCVGGSRTCSGGAFGACVGQVLPGTETCNGADEDCDGVADDAAGGGPLTQACYTGMPGTTQGVGTCVAGTQTCSGGMFSATCVGQVVPVSEICGNGQNDDCDGNASDTSEGCFVAVGASDIRLDAILASAIASTPGQHHSFDVDLATVGTNVYAAFSDSRVTSGSTPRNIARVYLARSTNDGVTFSSPLTLVSDNVNRCDTNADATVDGLCAATAPRVVTFGTTVIVTYVQLRGNQTRDIFIAVSTNSGATFATPIRLDADNNTEDAFHFDVAAVLSGAVIKLVVTWEELDTGTLARRVKARRTLDAGVAAPTFSTVQTVNKGLGTPNAGRPKAIFGTSDRIVFVWREKRTGAAMDIYTNLWNNASTNVEPADLRIDTDVASTDFDDLPVLARLGDEIYVAWEDFKTDGGDISFMRSTNNGTSFFDEKTLDDQATELTSSLAPSIAAVTIGAENRVYVAWMDTRDGTEIYVARSVNGGAAFGAGARASSVSNPVPGVSSQHEIFADSTGRVAVGYTSTRNGAEDIYVGFSLDGGATWQPLDVRADSDTAGAGTSVDPAFAMRAAGGVAAAWIDYRSNGIRGDVHFRVVSP